VNRQKMSPGHRVRLCAAALLVAQIVVGGYGFVLIAGRWSAGSEHRAMDRALDTVKELEKDGRIVLPQGEDAHSRAARPFANVAKYEGLGYATYGYALSAALVGFGVAGLALLITDRALRRRH
jgi:hypothetical protein